MLAIWTSTRLSSIWLSMVGIRIFSTIMHTKSSLLQEEVMIISNFLIKEKSKKPQEPWNIRIWLHLTLVVSKNEFKLALWLASLSWPLSQGRHLVCINLKILLKSTLDGWLGCNGIQVDKDAPFGTTEGWRWIYSHKTMFYMRCYDSGVLYVGQNYPTEEPTEDSITFPVCDTWDTSGSGYSTKTVNIWNSVQQPNISFRRFVTLQHSDHIKMMFWRRKKCTMVVASFIVQKIFATDSVIINMPTSSLIWIIAISTGIKRN